MGARRREPLILAATGALATCVPVTLSAHLAARVDALGPALSELTGEPSRVGGVEASLAGSVRLTDVEIGDVLRADAIEAAVAPSSLWAGALGIDEIRLERPRLRARVDGAGDSNLARILRRVAARRARAPGGDGGGDRRLRRIVVTEGALVLDVVGVGRFEAREVALHPQAGGVRVVTGPVRAEVDAGPFTIAATFTRGGGDLALPDARLSRFLAVGGAVTAAAPGAPPLELHGAALGWSVWQPGALALRGDADDGGVPRPITVTARPGDAAAIDVRGDDLPLALLAAVAPRGIELAGAHASGAITLVRTPDGWTAAADGAVAGVRVDHPAIADAAFVVDGQVRARLERRGPELAVRSVEVTRGALRARGHGRVRAHAGRLAAGELDLAVDDAACLDLVAAVPAALRGPVGALALDGRLAGALRVAFDLDAPPGDGVELAVALDNRCAVLADPPEADVGALARVADHRFPDGTRAPVGPGVGDWTPMISLPAHVDGAFVAAEDARFFDHRGFDLAQIARSLEIDLREGRFARGGSTISQQLVKNAFLSNRRTLDRKLQEAVLTWRLEAVLTKRQILERYLNIVELGPGVHGVAAAARHWFGKPAADLTVKEAAFLAALTPEPRTMSRRIAAARGLDPHSADRIDTVLRHMERAGVIDAAARDAARAARLVLRDEAIRAGIPSPLASR